MDNLRAAANEKLTENRVHREAVLSLISSGEAIAFVGAGLSLPLKYPSWDALLATLQAQAHQIATFNPPDHIQHDFLQYAEAIKDHFKKTDGGIDQYRNLIGREFSPRDSGENCTRTHQCLVKLPFRAFITTNYDVCIELALQDFSMAEMGRARTDPGVIIKANKADRHLISLFLRSISKKSERHCCFVAHLHGRWDDTQNIILTTTDYADAYGDAPVHSSNHLGSQSITLHRQLIWSLFATRRMVFVGCSMDDPYIKRLLDTVARDLWEFDQPIHYAILPLDKKILASPENQEAAFWRYGLQVVYFDNLTGNFTDLDHFFEEALERIPVEKVKAANSLQRASADLTDRDNATKASESLAEAAIDDLAGSQAWLEKVNESTVATLRKNED